MVRIAPSTNRSSFRSSFHTKVIDDMFLTDWVCASGVKPTFTSFDTNGDLLTLHRKALLGSSMTEIDNLQYTYSDETPTSAAHSTYHYAMGNPVMFNDPLGLKSEATQGEFQPFWDVALALTKENGGHWTSSSGWIVYESSAEGFYEGAATMSRNEAWGLYPGWAYDYREAAANYNGGGNRSQVASVSTGGYVISGGYYKTASGAPTTVNGKSGDFKAYYVGGNGSENVKARHKSSFGDALIFTDSHFNGALGTVGVAVQGYNKLPNDIKRAYAYKLSKMTGAKSGKIFQGAKSFANGTGKLVSKLGPVGTVLGAGVQAYEYSTDTWDAHTIVNTSLMIGAGVATIFAAPAVLTGIAIYGVGDYFFDFGGTIDKTVGRNSGVWGL